MDLNRKFSLSDVKDESRLWGQLIANQLNLPRNVLSICQHGFTEMLNNVIDHSSGEFVSILCSQDENRTCIDISDDGVGVFSSLQTCFGFDSEIHALIELVKGKITIAPEAHSGEGIFFSSKMFDRFIIESGTLSVLFENDSCVVRSVDRRQGTRFAMEIDSNSARTVQEVFARFTDPDEFTFCKTRFFVSLAAFEGELTSRSQAKRVAARFEKFQEVDLDFSSVDYLGQAFADELVRVWPLAHPGTRLKITKANESSAKMLKHVMGRQDLPQPSTPVEIELEQVEPTVDRSGDRQSAS